VIWSLYPVLLSTTYIQAGEHATAMEYKYKEALYLHNHSRMGSPPAWKRRD
jgi:hypothetical protein